MSENSRIDELTAAFHAELRAAASFECALETEDDELARHALVVSFGLRLRRARELRDQILRLGGAEPGPPDPPSSELGRRIDSAFFEASQLVGGAIRRKVGAAFDRPSRFRRARGLVRSFLTEEWRPFPGRSFLY
jgi:hypothetical protein